MKLKYAVGRGTAHRDHRRRGALAPAPRGFPDGTRFAVDTSSVTVLARFIAGFGEIARPETTELKAEVRAIAAATLANAS